MHKFYRAFEDKHRGSRDLIKSRLQVYLPFVKPVAKAYPDSYVIDLGCGRGEWLETLKDNGIRARGVDLDDGMLSISRELGLEVKTDDAICYLERLENESHIVVSGFHIAEHLNFSELQTLVKESLRVLQSGGLLILETPNPENIIVGTSAFYTDPTHQRPIPPNLLEFLIEYQGFSRVKVVRLQEDSNLLNDKELSLIHILGGVSPDYAVIAQKGNSDHLTSALNNEFRKEYGLTLEQLSLKYHEQTKALLQQQHHHLSSTESMLQESQEKRYELEVALRESQEKRYELEVALRESQEKRYELNLELNESQKQRYQQELELQENQRQRHLLQLEIKALVNSPSMKITAPLRWAKRQLQYIKSSLKVHFPEATIFFSSRIKYSFRYLLLWVTSNSVIRKTVKKIVARYPVTESYFRKIYRQTKRLNSTPLTDNQHLSPKTLSPYLSREAKKVYKQFKKKIR